MFDPHLNPSPRIWHNKHRHPPRRFTIHKKAARPTYHCAILDFDGTLVHTQPAIIHSLKETFQELTPSYAVEEETLRQGLGLGLTLADTFRHLAPHLVKEHALLDRFIAYYRKTYAKKNGDFIRLFEGVKESLERLHQLNTTLIITSNKGENAIHAVLEKFHLQHFIDLVIGERVDIEKKPSPELFEKIIKLYYPKIDLKKTIVIGDTVTDLRFADNLGIDSCWAAYGYGNKIECKALEPTFTIHQLPDVFKIGEFCGAST